MKTWNGGTTIGIINSNTEMIGYYPCSSEGISSGNQTYGISTTYTNGEALPAFAQANGAVFDQNADSKEYYMVGVMKYHGDPNQNNTLPVFFLMTGNDGIDGLLALPYFTKFGNTPASTTNWETLMLQLYQAGMWCWTEGGSPIIGNGVKPKINLPFWMDECWDGSNIVNFIDVANTALNISVTNAQAVSNFDAPWIGTFNYNSQAYIEVADDMNIADAVTIEYVGLKNGTGNRYICDARNDGGQWFLTDYSGYNWNWANKLQWNGNNPNIRHHCLATADAGQNVSRLYIGDQNGWGNVANGTANQSLCTIGADFNIGTRYTVSSTWNDEMSMFRVWDFALNDIQAEICWLHSKMSVSY